MTTAETKPPVCDGEIRRYSDAYECGNTATWNVQIAGRITNACACGHHLGQVLDDFRKAFGDDVQFAVRRLAQATEETP